MEWISVKDELPEKGRYLLSDGEKVSYGWVIDKQYYKRPPKEHFRTSTGFFDATHWMPLPEPPK